MTTKNKIIFFLIFCVLQITFVFLYLKQERIYLFEYQAYVDSNNELIKQRMYNDAVNIVFNELTKKIKFKNNNIKVIGNIPKDRMLYGDWHLKWFAGNQKLYFSINQNNKNLNPILEKELSDNFTMTLKKVKLDHSNKVKKLNKLKYILNKESLNTIRMLNKNKNMFIDTLTHLKSDYLKMVDDPEIRLSFVDTILLALKEDIKNTNLLNETVISDSFEKSLHNVLIAIEKDIRKSFIEYKMSYSEDALKIIWDEKIKYFNEEPKPKKNKGAVAAKEHEIISFNQFSQFIIEEQIKFLTFQLKLIDRIGIKQTRSVKNFKPFHLYLFSAIFFQIFFYLIFDVIVRLIKKSNFSKS